MKTNTVIVFLRFLLAGSLFLTISGCIPVGRDQRETHEVPEDIPLSEFIIGEWKSEQAYNYEGKESSYKYEVEFVDKDTLKFVVLSLEDQFLDGTTSQYSFADSNTIFIDNKRIRGGESWFLERKGQTLIVHRTIDSKTDRIIFTRTSNK